MAKFKYTMDDLTAVREVKKAVNGKVAILKDKDNTLVVGTPPFMTINIKFNKGIVETSASLAGKILLSSVDSMIELTEGFQKV